MFNFRTLTKDWSNETIFIIGGGTSLKGFDFKNLKLFGKTLGVNRSAFTADCDFLFSLDQTFIDNFKDEIKQFSKSKVSYLAVSPGHTGKEILRVNYLIKFRGLGLSSNPEVIHGSNSGFGALNLALLKGCKKVVLLGFDMVSDQNKNFHFHESYTWQNMECNRFMDKWAKEFNLVAHSLNQDVKILNAVGNPKSKITCFNNIDLCDLEKLDAFW